MRGSVSIRPTFRLPIICLHVGSQFDVAGCEAMRASTSASQACGSTSLSFAVTISEYMAAARSPPRSEPANSHDFLPRAIPRNARSAALFDRHTRPSSRKRVNDAQRLSM